MIAFDLTDEQKQLRETARDFTAKEIIPVAGRYDEAEEFPTEVLRKAWDVGLMNLEIPVEYGGVGLGVLDAVVVMEEINFRGSGGGTIMTAHGLASPPLPIAGTAKQQQHLPGAPCT
nr:acyl-CoA dehydrogenase family protein [Pseudomonadota bacterium]